MRAVVLLCAQPRKKRRTREPPVAGDLAGGDLALLGCRDELGLIDSKQRSCFSGGQDLGHVFAKRYTPNHEAVIGEVLTNGILDEGALGLARSRDCLIEPPGLIGGQANIERLGEF